MGAQPPFQWRGDLRLDVTNRSLRYKGSAHFWRTRQAFPDLDGDPVGIDHHGTLGHRMVIGEDGDLVVLAGVSMMAPRPSRSTWCTDMEGVPSTTAMSSGTLSMVAT
jgi:hypothetical protein